MYLNNTQNKYYVSNGCRAQIKFPTLCWDLGWECANPNLEELPYDYVVRGIDKSQTFKTVQIKQSYPYGTTKRQRCDIRKQSSKKKTKYSDGDFDYLAAFDPSDSKWYIIPWKEVKNVKSEINLSSIIWSKFLVNPRGD